MGVMSHAAQSVKFNRAQLKKKRSFKDLKESYIGYAKKGNLSFKTLTVFEQQKIRDKIIAQAKRDKIHVIKMRVLAFLILCAMGIGIYVLLS